MESDNNNIKSELRRNFMLEGNLVKVIFLVALPQVVTMLIDSIYNMADAFFVSGLGEAAVAAVGVNDSLMMLIRAVSIGFGMGSASFISRALGAKRDEDASRAATTTLLTAIAVVGALAIFGSVFLEPLVNLLGATDNIRPFSMDYARWILISSPITAATVVLAQILRGEGSTTFSMAGNVAGCVINIALDPIFISILGMGVAGAAIATSISKSVSLIILLWPFIRKRCVIRLKLSFFSPTREIYSEIAKMGIPTMLRTSMMSVAAILINNVAAGFGDAALAAISVANRSMRFIGAAVMGFSQGFQPIAGYSWGAKKYGRVLRSFLYTIAIGGIVGSVLGAGLAIFAEQTVRIFASGDDVTNLGTILIRSQSIMLVPHVWVMIVTGLYQALGDALKAGVLGLSRQLFVLIPCVLVMSFVFGEIGLAYSQAVSDALSFIMAAIMVIPMIKRLISLDKETRSNSFDSV